MRKKEKREKPGCEEECKGGRKRGRKSINGTKAVRGEKMENRRGESKKLSLIKRNLAEGQE